MIQGAMSSQLTSPEPTNLLPLPNISRVCTKHRFMGRRCGEGDGGKSHPGPEERPKTPSCKTGPDLLPRWEVMELGKLFAQGLEPSLLPGFLTLDSRGRERSKSCSQWVQSPGKQKSQRPFFSKPEKNLTEGAKWGLSKSRFLCISPPPPQSRASSDINRHPLLGSVPPPA